MSLRTGGREAVEDTPVTGATEETAADHIALAIQSEIDYDPIWCRGMAREITERLESEGYAIVRAEDALTAEDRAAAAQLVDTHFSDYLETAIDEEPDVFHRMNLRDSLDSLNNLLRAIAAGGQA